MEEGPSAWDEFSTWWNEIPVIKRIREGSLMLKIVIAFASFVFLVVSVLLILVCHLKKKQGQNKGSKDDIE